MSSDHDSTDEIRVRREGAVAVVSFNRPAKLNAMTKTMSLAWADAMRAADADPAVRAIVITGEGRGFCAGADVARLEAGAAEIRHFLPPQQNLPSLAFALRTPVVCAVNGPVAGIGFAYMMAADVRFVAAEASISTTFARLGLVGEYGLSWLLPRVIGAGAALDLLLSGRTISGEYAERIGLAQYVSPAATVLADAIAYAVALCENCSPYSMAMAKAQVYTDLDSGRHDALTRALELMNQSFDGPDLGEALAARSQKRVPAFAPLSER